MNKVWESKQISFGNMMLWLLILPGGHLDRDTRYDLARTCEFWRGKESGTRRSQKWWGPHSTRTRKTTRNREERPHLGLSALDFIYRLKLNLLPGLLVVIQRYLWKYLMIGNTKSICTIQEKVHVTCYKTWLDVGGGHNKTMSSFTLNEHQIIFTVLFPHIVICLFFAPWTRRTWKL